MSTIYGMTVTFGGGGISGSTVPQVIVNAPTGSTVTATKGDITLTAVENSGVWVFDLPEFGSWAITATNGVQTASQSVVFEGEKMLTFSYFSASIAVTYPAGSTCTCSNGATTLTAPDTSGSCTFIVTGTGIWTIESTDGDNYATTDVEIVNDGQMATASLKYISDNFSDNSWADIISACQSGTVPETWLIGDSKPMTINGAEYQIDIIGKNHDTYTGGGTAPLTFQLHDIYASTYAMNSSDTNSGGYDNTVMHTSHLPSIKSCMPSEVQAAIKSVDKKSSEGNQSSTIEIVSCGLFLLSEIEIFGSLSFSFAGEGSQYEYYSAGNSKVKYRNGTAAYWWGRSPRKNVSNAFCAVDGIGGRAAPKASTSSPGTSFAFCF